MLHNREFSDSNLDPKAGCSEDFQGFIRNYSSKMLHYYIHSYPFPFCSFPVHDSQAPSGSTDKPHEPLRYETTVIPDK